MMWKKNKKMPVTIYALGGLDSREAHIIHLSAGPLISGLHIYVSWMLGVPIYFIPVGWTAPSGPTYMLAACLAPHIFILLGGPLVAGMHICRLACLECPYILSCWLVCS